MSAGQTALRERTPFTARAAGGPLGGWIAGAGAPVLLLHGGPGLSYTYLDGLGAELSEGFTVASYQQRGLAPSTISGPFTVAQAIDDALDVLDALAWERALLVGHSWGGQLALRLAAACPQRVLAALAVDPLGLVGDGGMAAFETEMLARTPAAGRRRARELDERAMAGLGTTQEACESLAIMWPAYFADPVHAPAMPEVEISVDAYSGIVTDALADTEAVASELAATTVPFGVVAGAASPMPWGQAARMTVELCPHGQLTVVPGAGHFPWVETPGCVRAALERLIR